MTCPLRDDRRPFSCSESHQPHLTHCDYHHEQLKELRRAAARNADTDLTAVSFLVTESREISKMRRALSKARDNAFQALRELLVEESAALTDRKP